MRSGHHNTVYGDDSQVANTAPPAFRACRRPPPSHGARDGFCGPHRQCHFPAKIAWPTRSAVHPPAAVTIWVVSARYRNAQGLAQSNRTVSVESGGYKQRIFL